MLTVPSESYVLDCEAQLSSIALPALPGLWILGQPLLRRYATAFDAERRAVGFKRRKRLRNS